MFRRGFKAWCENVAAETRKQLSIAEHEPLDPMKLADVLGVTVLFPSSIEGLSENVLTTLLEKDPDSWSAITLTLEPKPIIVLNSSHAPSRRTSDLAHELSHLLLKHKPSQTGVTPDGFLLTAYDRQQEEEAEWLSGCLLFPRTACLYVRRRRIDAANAARDYGISSAMFRYRMNVSGVERQISGWKRRVAVSKQI